MFTLQLKQQVASSDRGHGSQPLQEGGMGVVEKHVSWVRGEIAEIVDRKFFQGRSQGRGARVAGGKTVCFILIPAG